SAHLRALCRFALILAACCLFGVAAPASAANQWIVNSTTDDTGTPCSLAVPATPCTLRSAVSQATTGDTITFSTLFLTPQTIGIGSTLTIDKNLTIVGTYANLLTLRATSAGYAILTIPFATTVTVEYLTITNGVATDVDGGGGIVNRGTLSLLDVVL